MSPATHVVLLVLAGVGAGLTGYGAGLASLVSYPALLAAGLSPLAANATNTAALTGIALGGAGSARQELAGTRARLVRFGIAGLVGGAAGALLLVVLPESVFAAVVPWLVVLGSVVLLLRPWLQRYFTSASEGSAAGGVGGRPPSGQRLHRGRLSERSPLVVGVVVLLAVYGGYFGAGAGTLVIATFALVLPEPLTRIAALRTVVLGLANIVATAVFIARGLVEWGAAVPLALGMVAGAAIAPRILRRLPEVVVRVVVAVAGLGLAVFLLAQG